VKIHACPHCGTVAAELQARPWGRSPENAPGFAYLPFVCGHCRALAMIDMESGALIDPPEEVIAIMRSNPVLWAAIERAREKG
jgi:hypothetical protein